MISLLIFLLILSLLVFIHEFGHFVMAKRAGMNVEEFGFGFPPRLFGIQKQNGKWKLVGGRTVEDKTSTVYSINWIFAGGFVRITGENAETKAANSFIHKPWLSKFLVVVAGVVMNVVLAFFLFWLAFVTGSQVGASEKAGISGNLTGDVKVIVFNVVPNSPASKAGLRSGDEIINIDGKTFGDSPEVSMYVKENAGKPLKFHIGRGNHTEDLTVMSDQVPPEGRGPTGISLAVTGKVKYEVAKGFIQAARATYIGLVQIPVGLYQVISSGIGFDAVGGPVRIYEETSKISNQSGLSGLIPFAAILSLNLAFLNILPIPALDGGRLLFLIIEGLRRKKNKPELEQYANAIGFLLLIGLVILVTIKDIIR